jgi:hypothetical protein
MDCNYIYLSSGLINKCWIKVKIFVGIDTVLFSRCQSWGFPFICQKKHVGDLAIVVCQFHSKIYIRIWRSATVLAI